MIRCPVGIELAARDETLPFGIELAAREPRSQLCQSNEKRPAYRAACAFKFRKAWGNCFIELVKFPQLFPHESLAKPSSLSRNFLIMKILGVIKTPLRKKFRIYQI